MCPLCASLPKAHTVALQRELDLDLGCGGYSPYENWQMLHVKLLLWEEEQLLTTGCTHLWLWDAPPFSSESQLQAVGIVF